MSETEPSGPPPEIIEGAVKNDQEVGRSSEAEVSPGAEKGDRGVHDIAKERMQESFDRLKGGLKDIFEGVAGTEQERRLTDLQKDWLEIRKGGLELTEEVRGRLGSEIAHTYLSKRIEQSNDQEREIAEQDAAGLAKERFRSGDFDGSERTIALIQNKEAKDALLEELARERIRACDIEGTRHTLALIGDPKVPNGLRGELKQLSVQEFIFQGGDLKEAAKYVDKEIIGELQDPNAKDRLHFNIAREMVWAGLDPKHALEYIEKNIADPQVRKEAMEAMVQAHKDFLERQAGETQKTQEAARAEEEQRQAQETAQEVTGRLEALKAKPEVRDAIAAHSDKIDRLKKVAKGTKGALGGGLTALFWLTIFAVSGLLYGIGRGGEYAAKYFEKKLGRK